VFLPSSPDRPEERPLSPQLALRIAVLGMIALGAFGVLIFRLWALQVLASTKYQTLARRNVMQTVRLPADRGSILDARGVQLVRNRGSREVQLDPTEIESTQSRLTVLRRLAPILDLRPRETLHYISQQHRYYPLEPVTIASDVNDAVVNYLGENAARFPGVSVVPNAARYYPDGRLGAHIFGRLGQVTASELSDPRYRSFYRPGDVIGQSGVEATYDRYLRGVDGKEQVAVDATGRPHGIPVVKPLPQSGLDLRLTIDRKTEAQAEAALAAGIRRASPVGANSGALIAMDPRTGAIKALVSWPSFDPNWLVSPKRNRGHLKWLDTAQPPPQFDLAIAGEYAPGSTFKPFTAIAAMESHLITASSSILCDGEHTYAKHVFHNFDPYIHQWMTLPTALTQSCDTFFYALGDKIYNLGRSQGHPLQRWARNFGFGKPTGIDIGGESAGTVPSQAWKTALYRNKALRRADPAWRVDEIWKPGDEILAAIGQGDLLVTPLQLAVGYSAIANGGYLVTPHVADDVEQGGIVRRSFASSFPRRKIPLSPGVLTPIRQGLEGVTHDPLGTASHYFATFPIDVAGKTGTAQRTGKPDNSLFVSYAPANDPKLVVVVVIAGGGHGGTAAAPTALDFYARYFGMPRPSLAPVQDASR
jgi:penicillin-binding protein 2